MPNTGQQPTDTQLTTEQLALLHSSIGHYARMLWDLQKARIAAMNRVGTMTRGHMPDEWMEKAFETSDGLTKLEQQLSRGLEKRSREHPMADWVEATPGIALGGFARLIGVTGDIGRFPTVSKLWKYLGLHVVDGRAPKLSKGEAPSHTNCQGLHFPTCKANCKKNHHPNCTPDGFGTSYSTQGRVVCHQLAESIVKSKGCNHGCPKECAKDHGHKPKCDPIMHESPYTMAYDRMKIHYETGRPDWTQARRNNAAMRYAIKELVKDLWIEWHRRGIGGSQDASSAAA